MRTQNSRLTLLALLLGMLTTLAPAASAQRRTTKARPKVTKAAPAKVSAPVIPVGTEMKIRLNSEIDTKNSRDGDKFNAVVLTPSKYADATVAGHIAKIDQSGKMKGRTSLVLAFDTISFSNGTSRTIAAQIVKVYGEDSAKKVDEEGNVQSGSKTSTTVKRTGGGAAAGAVIGAIAGGGKGAAIGAAIGAGVGAGSTYIQGSNKVKLEPGTEILIKTTK
ncbi:MAG: hypothetical protein HYR56_08165 [Acidobacteria bacterium]|nr:hypothetical protein [Acidobacteriota bacterium]MBI3426096.1 hypothetical protein [Acidobacteriota bacterium]